ncbi:MAG: BON domain-containing protein [Anaerolineae bacterium]|nr:BON domain-containing protein [Anaerolineae bacterium]
MYQGTGPYGGPGARYYQGPYPPTAGAARSDQEIRNEIVARLQADPWVNERNVNVQVSQGVVTLTGQVDIMEEKRSAGDDAYDTPGVVDVNNELRIAKMEPLTRARREPPTRRQVEQPVRPPAMPGREGGAAPRPR